VILVGALGVVSTLSLNVLERTRELAILGAIGATPRTMGGHIVFEGALIGFLSWIAALALAVPATAALAMKTGQLFIKTPLPLHLDATAIVVCLAVVVPLAALSSLYPAHRATHQPIHEALLHE
jgi:putative ABC transport system permease protein